MAVAYAADIRPKFRNRDLMCMRPHGIQLDDAGWMCDADSTFGFPDHGNARHVFDYLARGSMPPDGPWSRAWLDSYQAWMDAGFQP